MGLFAAPWKHRGNTVRRREREKRGLSIRQVAERTGEQLSTAAVSRIEQDGRNPSARSLVLLARALGIRFALDGTGVRIV